MLVRCIKREIRAYASQHHTIVNALLFFCIILTLFPFTISSQAKVLQIIGVGVIWIAALLSILLSMAHFFKDDYQDGTLDTFRMMPVPLNYYVIGKLLVQWLFLVLPLLVLTPVMAFAYHLSWHSVAMLLITLALGTPSLLFIAALIAALTLQLRRNVVLFFLMALPLYVPIIVFGAGAAVMSGTAVLSPLYILLAIFILTVILLPGLIAASLRIVTS